MFFIKKFRKKKSGNEGVWEIHNQLTYVKKKPEKGNFDPLISSPGVKVAINTVNEPKLTPLFPLQAWKLGVSGLYEGGMC